MQSAKSYTRRLSLDIYRNDSRKASVSANDARDGDRGSQNSPMFLFHYYPTAPLISINKSSIWPHVSSALVGNLYIYLWKMNISSAANTRTGWPIFSGHMAGIGKWRSEGEAAGEYVQPRTGSAMRDQIHKLVAYILFCALPLSCGGLNVAVSLNFCKWDAHRGSRFTVYERLLRMIYDRAATNERFWMHIWCTQDFHFYSYLLGKLF